ncbi:MAG: hypothetical protein AAGA61_01445 [Pseudomonadota bacterium]
MPVTANPGRDPFAFSLGGLAATNSFAFVPAIADDNLSRAWDRKLSEPAAEKRHPILRFEDMLARYFAPGCRGTA